MVQYGDDQDNDNDDDNSNTNEYPDNPPGICLEPAAARGKCSGVTPLENPVELPGVAPPENTVELPGVTPPENEVYENVVPPLLTSDYDSDDDSDGKDEDTYTSTQQRRRVIHPEAIPPTVSNLYNNRPWKQTDYMKEDIYILMSFAQVWNDLNEDALPFLQHKVMGNSEYNIYYTTVIAYTSAQYSL